MELLTRLELGYTIGKSAFLGSRPFLLYFKPTARCDLRCEICNRWKDHSSSEEELSLEQIRQMLAKFRRAGAVVLTLWGGEPTLRKDLPEILGAAKDLGFRTSMCTNSNALAKTGHRYLPLLDVLLCSLDGYGATHDRMRGVDGLFDRVVSGIGTATHYNHLDVKIWATVHRENLRQIEQLAGLARDLGTGIAFFPVSPIAGYNNDTVPSPAELRDAFTLIKRLKAEGLPIRNPDRVLDIMLNSAPFKCNFGRIAIHLDHRGHVYSCEDPAGTPLHMWGDVTGFEPLERYRSREFQEVVTRLESCDRCRLPCVVELADSLPASLANMFIKPWESRR